MTDDEDSSDENNIEPNFMEEHYNFLAAREQLQEFSGRVPTQRKNKRDSVNFPQQQHQQNKNKPKVRKFRVLISCSTSIIPKKCERKKKSKRDAKHTNFHHIFSPQIESRKKLLHTIS